MQAGWRIGSVFGIPLYLDPSWVFLVALITIADHNLWQKTYPSWSAITTWGAGLAMALLLLGSFFLHELGHGLVAKSQGMEVQSITLSFFGGMTSSRQAAKTAGQALRVAIAGPLVTLVIVVGLVVGILLIPDASTPARVVMERLAAFNLLLLVLNLVPAMPLDGGQILQAIVWQTTHSQLKGMRWTATVGKVLGWLAVVLGLVAGLTRSLSLFNGLLISMAGWFMVRNATVNDHRTDVQEALLNLKAEAAMTREFRVVETEMTLRQFADDYVLGVARAPVFFAASKGRYQGLVEVNDLQAIERSIWETQNLYRILQPLAEIPAVQEQTALVDVIQKMEDQKLPRITVLSPAGAVAGVIDRGDIVKALSNQMKLMIPAEFIQQIKADGAYPPDLPLHAIAQAAANLR
jgi:Zn-dependent protease/CBS domain-containing protein